MEGGKISFKLDGQSNKAGRFLLCEVRDGEGKKHSLFFSEGNGFTKGRDLLADKLDELGIKGKQEEQTALPSTNAQATSRSFADIRKASKKVMRTPSEWMQEILILVIRGGR